MARIRTIKPEFFTSEDIVALSAHARLLYIATWCEADREGRLRWKPKTFKIRYFPADDCDIDALARELIALGLVVLYDAGLAYIPSFARHQHLNPRESDSRLPEPNMTDASARVADASGHVSDTQGGREGEEQKQDQKQDQKSSGAYKPRSGSSGKPKSEKITFDTFIAECQSRDEKAIPLDHPVFKFAEKTGIPVEFVQLAWREFRRGFEAGGKDAKKTQAGAKGWRAHFDNCVRRNWFKFWFFAPDGDCQLTTAGIQVQREAHAEPAEQVTNESQRVAA